MASTRKLELLRDNHDRTHLGIILIGMSGIDQRFCHYPQLYSRLGFSHRYRALGREELLFVLDRHWKRLGRSLDPDDFTDAQAIAASLLDRLVNNAHQITIQTGSYRARSRPNN